MIYLIGSNADDVPQLVEKLKVGDEKVKSIFDFPGYQDNDFIVREESLHVLMVAFDGTSGELRKLLSVGPPTESGEPTWSAFVLEIASYSGYWDKELWEWFRAYYRDRP